MAFGAEGHCAVYSLVCREAVQTEQQQTQKEVYEEKQICETWISLLVQ